MNFKTTIWTFAIISLVVLSAYFIDYNRFEPNNWSIQIPDVGFTSTMRAVDLNQDGIKDLVIGGGGPEFKRTENGVTAIDGKDGTILWKVPTRNQVVGSPLFKDINRDSVPDVFIGGRSAILLGLNGKNGEIIWEYLPSFDGMDIFNDTTFLNFTTPQFIPDQDNDGLADLLVSFGGFVKAKTNNKDRPVGNLLVISSQNGNILHKIDMPDGKETYLSPLVYDLNNDGQLSVIFGSGGETINGHLYKALLTDLLEKKGNIEVLATGKGKGFIAAPILADVNLDGILDIIANPVNGDMICINGQTNEVIWELEIDSLYEVYTIPAPGQFTEGDTIPDFFISMGAGAWPNTKFTKHILVDGSSGQTIFSDTLGLFQYASPIVYDFNADGKDDILLAINKRQVIKEFSPYAKFYVNELKVLDVYNKKIFNIGKQKLGSNLGGTPLITDLDADGWVDILYCFMEDGNNFYSFQKGKIERTELKFKIKEMPIWGNFMGRNYNSVYQ